MSIHIMAPVWKACPYEGKKLLVLLALCDFADAEGNCWPKMEQIKDMARCSIDYARDCIRDFEGDGWITTTVHHGRGKTNEYVIHKNPVPRRVLENPENPVPSREENPPPSGVSGLYIDRHSYRGEKGENQDLKPATEEGKEKAGAQKVGRESPPASSGVLDGNGEIGGDPITKDSAHLSDGVIRGKMKKDGAHAWQVDRVLKSGNPTAAFYEWKENGRLPDKQGRVHQYKTRAEQNLSDRDAAYEALERMKKKR